MVDRPPNTTISTVVGFLKTIQTVMKNKPGHYAFRGARNHTWENLPGILRPDMSNVLTHERDVVRELLAVHPTEFSSDTSMFDRLVRMQHFNLPTRLIDVTANPLVALYFATEIVDSRLEDPEDGKVLYSVVPPIRRKYFDSDTVSCIANLANLTEQEKEALQSKRHLDRDRFNEEDVVDRLAQFVRAEKPSFRNLIDPDELDRKWYVVPKLTNKRIIAQNGAFVIAGLNTSRTSVPAGSAPLRFDGLRVEKNKKQEIRDELSTLGINHASLFPEIDKAADHIVKRYK